MSERMRYTQYLNEEERRKAEEKEIKKAEVKRRLEEAIKIRKGGAGNKGFMTPERKKKLRQLLLEKTKEELNRQQERKGVERRKIIAQRIGEKKQVDNLDEDTLRDICKEYQKRIIKLEDIKYDLEYEVRQKDFVVNELSIEVNNLRGKFVKPFLKKVKKYDPKVAMEKMAKVAAKADTNYRKNLKRVQSIKYSIGDDEKQEKPEWALKKEQGKVDAEIFDD